MVKKRSTNAASSTAFIAKWNGEDARLRQGLLDELNSPLTASVRQERIEETGETIKSDTTELKARLTEMGEKVDILNGMSGDSNRGTLEICKAGRGSLVF